MGKNERNERRRHTRYSHKTRIWVERGPGEEPVEVKTLNLSAGGLLLELDYEPEVDTNLVLFFEIPLLPTPVKAVYRVAHVEKLEGKVRYAVGTQQVAIEGITEERLNRFLEDLFA